MTDLTNSQAGKTAPQVYIGRSPAYLRCLERARAVAPVSLSILIMGPSGSGKEHIASLIHRQSGLRGPMLSVNCACLSPELGEAELFGHGKGAFTGATSPRKGLIDAAAGGTLFLDEVAELEPKVQGKLLRFLEDGTYRPLGSLQAKRADVRIVAATCRDLFALMEEGLFRSDLYERLAGYTLEVPALKERPGDVLRLARHFLKHDPICNSHRVSLSREAAQLLKSAPWPGNVRELRRVMRRIVLENKPRRITGSHVATALNMGSVPGDAKAGDLRASIEMALKVTGSLSLGALVREVGSSRSTVQRTLRGLMKDGIVCRVEGTGRARYGLPVPEGLKASQDLPEHLRQAMAMIGGRESIRTSELAHALGISSRTASRWLSQLVDLKALEPIGGEHRGRRYRRANG